MILRESSGDAFLHSTSPRDLAMPNKKIALVQMSCEIDTLDNLHKAAELTREAARAGANIVCLPELFRAQYFCQREEHALFDTAEAIPGPSTALLGQVAA